ncbi:sulfite exporter TauE/SafE family protein [Rhizobiaceae bacterium BDR2-2]|uniref:Probable membrane transporter protein n=1 Tax=Ectorhizobium quercum TaxID=2965071 RepID=A0AAE3MZS1_9HYPH|nr:sulfite exporter TauE/SafE family protein [Ectorhizobium quercum]MCX8998343.1 sulfite exporter TauE/SafE family protein [Ectorhizobium quercum]
MIEHTPAIVALACLASFLVGLSKGGLPSVGAIAVPLLAMVMSPVTAAALLLPIFVASDLVGLYLYRRDFSMRNLVILTPAAILGVAIGWFFSSSLSPAFIGLLVGLVGVLFCLNVWFGARFRASQREADVPRGIFWGALTGFTSFVSHTGAPPFQMYVLPQKLEKMSFAGTSTILFAIVNAVKLVPYWQLGQFSRFDTPLVLWLVPAAIAGTVAGRKLTEFIPDWLFFRLIQIALMILSLKLIFDYVAETFLGSA